MSDRLKKWVTGILTFSLVMSLMPAPALAEIVDEVTDQSTTTETPVIVDEAASDVQDTTPTEGGDEAVAQDEGQQPADAVDDTASAEDDVIVAAPVTDVSTQDAKGAPAEGEAAGTISEKDVAAIGETGYATLQAAIDAAQSGDTITLLADVNESITINKGITLTGGKTISLA